MVEIHVRVMHLYTEAGLLLGALKSMAFFGYTYTFNKYYILHLPPLGHCYTAKH